MSGKKRRHSQTLDLMVDRHADFKGAPLLKACHLLLPDEIVEHILSFRKKCERCGRRENRFAPADDVCVQCVRCYECESQIGLRRWWTSTGQIRWTCPWLACILPTCRYCSRRILLPSARPHDPGVYLFCNAKCSRLDSQADELAEMAAEFAAELVAATVTDVPVEFNVSIFSDTAYRHYTGSLFQLIENTHVDQ